MLKSAVNIKCPIHDKYIVITAPNLREYTFLADIMAYYQFTIHSYLEIIVYLILAVTM